MKKIIAIVAIFTLASCSFFEKEVEIAKETKDVVKEIASENKAVNIGVILGFTGPIESLVPHMAGSAELALKEVSDSGKFLNGRKIHVIRADSTCVDSSVATTAAERLVTSENVKAIVGPDCSGVTAAVINKVSAPLGVLTISSSATSPALTSIDDRGYFFRTVPSDSRQGQVLADVILSRGVNNVAITYTNNDYGKGLVESFSKSFKEKGGNVAIEASHEDGKADYASDVAALSASGAEYLVVFGYVDQGGKGIIKSSIETDAFKGFFGSDGMVGNSLIQNLGADINGFVVTIPGSESAAKDVFVKENKSEYLDPTSPFTGESYDAAALVALAMQAANTSDDGAKIKEQVLKVANAPGTKIGYGDLAKGLEILANGGDIDYVGVTGVEFTDIGETNGQYREQEIKNGKYTTVKTY